MPTFESRHGLDSRAGTALFLKRWLRRPFAMGAVIPSGRLLAEAMARATVQALEGRPGHVVELGAGTGEVTKALLAAGIPVEAMYIPNLGHGIDDTGIAMGAIALRRAFA